MLSGVFLSVMLWCLETETEMVAAGRTLSDCRTSLWNPTLLELTLGEETNANTICLQVCYKGLICDLALSTFPLLNWMKSCLAQARRSSRAHSCDGAWFHVRLE